MTGAVLTLWQREVIRFVRQRSRLIGALAQPVVFWLLLGGGLSASFRPPGAPAGTGYLAYLYPGILVLVLLFTAIFATIATVEDRRSGFLQGVLVAPVGRGAIVLGQSLGGTTLAVLQGALFLTLAPFAGVSLSPAGALASVAVMALVAFGLTNLGLLIAWRMESTQGFHAIMNLILIPIWLLSGAFFPANGVPAPLAWAMRLDPLTYGLAALRRCLDVGEGGAALPSLALALGVAATFGLVSLAAAAVAARRSATL
jgi:ABC-2 type transport system permease protein